MSGKGGSASEAHLSPPAAFPASAACSAQEGPVSDGCEMTGKRTRGDRVQSAPAAAAGTRRTSCGSRGSRRSRWSATRRTAAARAPPRATAPARGPISCVRLDKWERGARDTHTHFAHLQQRPFVDVVTHGHRSAVGAYCSSRARWALPLPLVHVRPRPPAPRPLHLLDIQPGAYMYLRLPLSPSPARDVIAPLACRCARRRTEPAALAWPEATVTPLFIPNMIPGWSECAES